MDLVSDVYKSNASFPPNDTYGLTNQAKRYFYSQ